MATRNFDVTALTTQGQVDFTARISELFQAIESHLQLLVRVRPFRFSASTGNQLLVATEQHIAKMADQRQAFKRDIYLLLTSANSKQVDHDFAHATGVLRALQLDPRELGDLDQQALMQAARVADETPGYVVVGDQLAAGVALRGFPGQTVDPGWLSPLFNVRSSCDIAVHIEPAERWHAVKRLNRRLRDLNGDRMAAIESERIGDARTDVGLDAAFLLRDRLARNIARPLDLSISALVYGPNPQALNQAVREVTSSFAAAGATAEVTHFRHRHAATTASPFGLDALGISKLVDSGAAPTCLPWTSSFIDDPNGYLLGRDLQSDLPVRVSPFSGGYSNANALIFAASGHGKSYALGNLVIEGLAHGVESVVIDPEGEYQRLIESLGGAYVQLAPGSGAAINIFDYKGSDESVCASVIDLVGTLVGQLSGTDRALIDKATRQVMLAENPNLRDLVPLMSKRADIASVLERFCSSAAGGLFCRPTSVSLDRPVIGFGLRELPREFMGAATTIISHWLWQMIRFQPRPRHLIFDEAGLLSKHDHLKAFMVELARRCRKYNASLVIATQNATDLLRSEDGRVVATNPSLVMLGGHREAELLATAEAFGLTETEQRFLSTAGRGDFLFIAGNSRVRLHVDVSPSHHALLTGSAPPPSST